MDEQAVKLQMEEWIAILTKWQEAYDRGEPLVSDKEYDDLYFALADLEKDWDIRLPNSPTQIVVYEVVSELKKVTHSHPMLSLDKTKNIEDIEAFVKGHDWIAMLKMDGLTCSISYDAEGNLVRAETRGDGYEGEDITHNIRHVAGVPLHIDSAICPLAVDGEIICKLDDFENFKDSYANSRNFAAGSIRLLDSGECAKRKLSFIAWDCFSKVEFETLSDKLNKLAELGFEEVSWMWFIDGPSHVVGWLKHEAEVNHYPIDGLVFKHDNCKNYEAAGRTDHHFRGGLALKFYDETYDTELLDIEWSMGRTGVLSPIAIFHEVEIDGAKVSRASLHNLNIMRDILGEWPVAGQKLKVYKANQIIPQVYSAEPSTNLLGADPAYFLDDPEVKFCFIPKVCPVCGGETEQVLSESGTVELYCLNQECPGKLVNRLDHWCGKKGLDIKGLSKATLTALVDTGWITCITDLYHLDKYREEWIKKPGFGQKSVDKVLNAIQDSRKTTLESVIAGLGIPLVGRTAARKIVEVFNNYNDFRAAIADGYNFAAIPSFGAAIHQSISTFDYSEVDKLVQNETLVFETETPEFLDNSNTTVSGLVFVITGKLHSGTRDAVAARIAAAGGKVTGSVSSKTNYLVTNTPNSNTTKNKDAQRLGVKIITEEELLTMLGN